MEDSNNDHVETEHVDESPSTKKSSKALLITVIIFILFLLLITFMVFSGSRSTQMEAVVTPTPEATDNGDVMKEVSPTETEQKDEVDDGSTITLTPTTAPTNTPTKDPTPTTSNPGGFQNQPTNTPTQGSLPLSN